MKNLNYAHVEHVLVDWLRDRIKKAGAKGAVLGLSGGIDSAVSSVLCKKAFGNEVLGIIMPCYSDKQDAEDARLVADFFNVDYLVKDLSSIYDEFLLTLDVNKKSLGGDLVLANIKPRLRMITLYYYASRYNYLVIGTDNWSELKVGYFTKYGDGGVDLIPLGSLVKTEVRELARYLKIPEKIITKSPSAGLWQGQTDEKEMGFSYETLDHYILTGEAEPEVKEKVEKIARKIAHKLNLIPIPERKIFSKGD